MNTLVGWSWREPSKHTLLPLLAQNRLCESSTHPWALFPNLFSLQVYQWQLWERCLQSNCGSKRSLTGSTFQKPRPMVPWRSDAWQLQQCLAPRSSVLVGHRHRWMVPYRLWFLYIFWQWPLARSSWRARYRGLARRAKQGRDPDAHHQARIVGAERMLRTLYRYWNAMAQRQAHSSSIVSGWMDLLDRLLRLHLQSQGPTPFSFQRV